MDIRNTAQRAPPTTSAGMDHSEEMLAELDEPPDELLSRWSWSPKKLKRPAASGRRESLLTRQLHSETEHTDDEPSPPPRTFSTQSTWSNPSTASTAELTSDDGHSVASPAVSPPLPPTHMKNALPVSEKPLEPKVKIVGQDHVVPAGEKETSSEKTVEANLGRKRCISFACKGKQESKPTPPPTSEPAKPETTSPPKRKCMLTFACPSRNDAASKPAEKPRTKRTVSPPPPTASERRSSGSAKHRGSDSTVTHVSPKSVRKTQVVSEDHITEAKEVVSPTLSRKYSNDSEEEDHCGESVRFHEFAAGEGEPEDWVKESTCHRSRLTIDDTLKKENYIRKACEDVEDALNEEEEEAEEEELEEELALVHDSEGEMEGDAEEDEDDEDESDDGFHSDDEEGFANSDSEDDSDSDFEWWKPGGLSTAATSVDQLDRLAIVNSQQPIQSSMGSISSGHMSPLARQVSMRKSANSRTPAMKIQKVDDADLPDSTDFVCGTLDEDRPLEQAYINRIRSKEGKRKVRPQDIDPTFPTSDPEMDEEDNDDVDEVEESDEEEETFMHGDLDELHGAETGVRKTSPRLRAKSKAHYSPPPSAARHHSPPPARRGTCRSPPPPMKRTRAPSPAPRKLFGHSPQRVKSPAPGKRMTSPPNSPIQSNPQLPAPLAGRPQLTLTHTASLPRGGGATLSNLVAFAKKNTDISDSDTTAVNVTEVPRRGAIDIVKGLEKKRQRRKEKLWQKFCAKAAAKGESKTHKVKPGKGAERMREVGLQLQQYHGKAEHILSL